jgi:hypothetical protein
VACIRISDGLANIKKNDELAFDLPYSSSNSSSSSSSSLPTDSLALSVPFFFTGITASCVDFQGCSQHQ